MCLAWLAQLMGVTMVHANLRHWFKLFYASICTFVLFGLDQVITLHTLSIVACYATESTIQSPSLVALVHA